MLLLFAFLTSRWRYNFVDLIEVTFYSAVEYVGVIFLVLNLALIILFDSHKTITKKKGKKIQHKLVCDNERGR